MVTTFTVHVAYWRRVRGTRIKCHITGALETLKVVGSHRQFNPWFCLQVPKDGIEHCAMCYVKWRSTGSTCQA